MCYSPSVAAFKYIWIGLFAKLLLISVQSISVQSNCPRVLQLLTWTSEGKSVNSAGKSSFKFAKLPSFLKRFVENWHNSPKLRNFTDVRLVGGHNSLRSSLLEVVGAGKDGRARGRHVSLPRARLFFLAPTSSKRVLCRLGAQTYSQQTSEIFVTSPRYCISSLA